MCFPRLKVCQPPFLQGLYHDEIYGIVRPIAQLLSLRKDAHDGFILAHALTYMAESSRRRHENWHFRLPMYKCVLKQVGFSLFNKQNIPRGVLTPRGFL